MPPRKQVYGKPSHLYSSFNAFHSPVKLRKQEPAFEVLEVAEELSRLTVHTKFPEAEAEIEVGVEDEVDTPVRQPLSERAENTDRPKPVRQRTTSQPSPSQRDVKKTLRTEPQPERPEHTQSPIPLENTQESRPETDLTPTRSESVEEGTLASKTPEPRISNAFTKHASSLLSLSSQDLTSFPTWSDQLASHFAVTKIAEASFGEVYRLALLKSHSGLGKSDESVLKIIALKPPTSAKRKMTKAARKRTEMMSNPEDVAGEVRLMQRMTCTPGFTNFREICVLQGRPGDAFASAWSAWNDSQKSKGKETSVFPDPSKKASYSEDQLWAVIEMQDAGTDLENTKVGNVWLAWDIFWGVVLALGKGEEAARFEHRDLHMGNICISGLNHAGKDKGARFIPTDFNKKLGFTDIEATIIDYTISRAEMGVSTEADGEEDVAFLDLEKDLTLFEGDAEEEYQYEIYRYMRAAMYLGEPIGDLWERWDEAESSGRTWRGYHPQTNLVWLHFILHKISEQVEWPSSTADTFHDDNEVIEKAQYLEAALLRVEQLLDPEQMPQSGLRSASDLVAMALDEGWLDKEDVQGRGGVAQKTKTKRRKARNTRTKKS